MFIATVFYMLTPVASWPLMTWQSGEGCNVRLFSSCCHAPDSPKMKNTFYFLSFYFPRFFRRRECFRKVSMSGTDLFGRCLFLVSSGQKNKTLTCVIKYIKQTWTYTAQWKGHFSFSFLFIYRVSTKSKKILQKFFWMNLLRGWTQTTIKKCRP